MARYFDIHSHQKTKIEKDTVRCLNISQPDLTKFLVIWNNENFYYSVGLHPWYLSEEFYEADLRTLREILERKEKVIAIGECGLDSLCGVDEQLQEKAFVEQLRIAEKHALPVVIHCVRAWNELVVILKREKIKSPVIIHGFNNRISILEMLLGEGYFISMGAAFLENNSLDNKVILNHIPDDFLFLETDDREVPIQKVYAQVAVLKDTTVENLQQLVEDNVMRVFTKFTGI